MPANTSTSKKQKITSISEYIGWLFSQYKDFMAEAKKNITLKLIKTETSSDGTILCLIQIIGKAKTLKMSAEKILQDNELIELFSSKDISAITLALCKDKKTNKIVSKNYCPIKEKFFVHIQDVTKKEVLVKTASEIFNDKTLLNSLSIEEATDIGYLMAEEKENLARKQAKKLIEAMEK